MNIFAHTRQAWQNLRSNKMRSFLSVLWLVIGVFSVTVMVSVGEWLQSQILWEFSEASQNTITIIAGKIANPFEVQRSAEIRGFTDTDVAFFKEAMPFITNITPLTELTEEVTIRWEPVNVRIIAGNKDYMAIEWLKITAGRWLTDQDSTNYSNVVVVSQNTVKDFMDMTNEEALWKEILIWWQYFTIIGTTKEQWWGFVDIKTALIPVTTAQQKITSDPFYQYVVFEIDDNMNSEEAVRLAKYTLLKWQWVSHMDDALFQVMSTQTMMEQITTITTILQLALGWIWAIALMVGGIWVMNIMLVSVTERTREIGIRKAIWARHRDILLQFLTESLLLGMFGCIIWVGLSWWVIEIVQMFKVPALLNSKTILIAVSVAGWTWIIFWVGPARKAAKMKPIDALRFE